MPYILPDQRPRIDAIVKSMIEEKIEPKGEMNYLLFAYAKRAIKPSYNNYKELIGELHCVITEIERRLLAPYEDQKIESNGDVE